MKHLKPYLITFLIIVGYRYVCAQSRNGYQINGFTVAGGHGSGKAANQLNKPEGICVDASGNLYVADSKNNRVQKWAPGATVGITVAGGHGNGARANQLSSPEGITVDAGGNLFICDEGNHRVQEWSPGADEGVTVAGGNEPGAAANLLFHPFGISRDDEGNLYIADFGNSRVQKWPAGASAGFTVVRGHASNPTNPSDRIVKTNTTTGFGIGGQVKLPEAPPIGIDATSGYGLNVKNAVLFKGDLQQNQQTKVPGLNEFRPSRLFVDGLGNVYVVDSGNNRVQKWPVGATEGITVASPVGPEAVFVDPSGNIFVTEPMANRVELWAPGAANGVTVAGGADAGNTAGLLDGPTAIWLDSAGNIYVTDKENQRVQKFEKVDPNMVAPQPKPVEVVVHHEPVNSDHVIVNDYQVVKPPPPTILTTLNWLKPASSLDDLPGGVYSTAVTGVSISVKITSTAAINPDKIKLLLNGNVLREGGKMRAVDLKTVKSPGGGNKKYEYLYSTTVTVPNGKSSLQVSYGDDITDLLPVSYTPQSLNLYVLSIGTAASGLKYPQKDALDFAGVFRSQQGDDKLFQQVQIETLTGEAATAVAIGGKIAEWGGKQYGPNDVLFIFISSHGYTQDGNLKITGSDYKTITANLTTLDFKQNVLDVLEAANCKKFVFLDACHSGAGIKAAPADVSNAIQKMIGAGNNTTIITSSSGEEQSWEDEAWQNGAFTRAIKEALTEKRATTGGSRIVNMDDLFSYLSKRVPELVRAAGKTDYGGHPVTQTPKMYNPKGNVSIYVY